MRWKMFITMGAGLWAVLVTQLLSAGTLEITLDNVASDDGQILVQVLRGEAEFKGETPATMSIMQRASAGTMRFQANGLPPGEYAVRVMHDKNENGELDSNLVGMPREPWAMSNNARGNFGPPKWADVKFEVDDGTAQQTMQLNR